jgi:tRNA nucleotidyltransferase (CCA-adding enzyme)
VFQKWFDLIFLNFFTKEIGTPKQDAFRRDLTINSLFYNINTNKIEDFTGFGVSDLKLGIVRTPLEPLETFIDDPLRMLRTIRFACRYNFLVSDEAIEGARNEKIEKAFGEKISRERVGTEMEKILSSDDPIGGYSLIHEMGMRDYVFSVPKINVKQSKKIV